MVHCVVKWLTVVVTAASAAPHVQAQVSCLMQSLSIADGEQGDRFGSGLAIDGDVAVIGARAADATIDNCGVVYVFARGADRRWTEIARITPPDAATGDQFGGALGLEGNILVIGAAGDDDAGTDTGSIYIYRRGASPQQWLLESKVVAPDNAMDFFGSTVALSAGRIVVGTWPNWISSGQAFLVEHEKGSWGITAEFTSPFIDADDAYGIQLDIDGPWLIVGAPGVGDKTNWHGAICVYHHDSVTGDWPLHQILSPSDPADRGFGASVNVSGNRIAVGGATENAFGSPLLAASFYRLHSDLTWVADGRFLHQPNTSSVSAMRWSDLDGDVFVSGGRWPWGDSYGRTKVLMRAGEEQWRQVGDHLPVEHGPYHHNEQGLGSRVAVNGLTIFAADQIGTVAAPDTWAGCVYVYELVDRCELRVGDVNRDGAVDIGDLTFVIDTWGACPSPSYLCLSDIAPSPAGDGQVNIDDLLLVISSWGS